MKSPISAIELLSCKQANSPDDRREARRDLNRFFQWIHYFSFYSDVRLDLIFDEWTFWSEGFVLLLCDWISKTAAVKIYFRSTRCKKRSHRPPSRNRCAGFCNATFPPASLRDGRCNSSSGSSGPPSPAAAPSRPPKQKLFLRAPTSPRLEFLEASRGMQPENRKISEVANKN